MLSYEQTIAILGNRSYHLYMSGAWQYTPDGISIVAEIYGVPERTVHADVDAFRTVMIEKHIAQLDNKYGS